MASSLTHSKFTVERRYPHPVETVLAALADPDKRRRWYAESDSHEILEYEADFRPGGSDRLTYRFTGDAPIKGMIVANQGHFENIQPNASVVTSSSMWLGEQCISTALVTLELFAEAQGTRLLCTHQAVFFPGADGPELREQGWNVTLDKLGQYLG